MGLINLRTNLRDLQFGQDKYGGGSSKEPFIVTKIPAIDEPLPTGEFSFDLNISANEDDILPAAGNLLAGAGSGAVLGGSIGGLLGGPAGAIAGLGIGGLVGAGGVIGTGGADVGLSIKSDLTFTAAQSGTGGPDFLIRGGTLLPNILANDVYRLAKFFTSTDGILFTVKQNLLSKTGVFSQTTPSLGLFGFDLGSVNEGIYTPISTILGAVGSPLGLHPNKQGINPLVSGLLSPRTYSGVIKNEINNDLSDSEDSGFIQLDGTSNRLANLYRSKILVGFRSNINTRNNKITGRNIFGQPSTNLISYGGGPDSILGLVGKTNIRYAEDNTGSPLQVTNVLTTNNGPAGYATLTYDELAGAKRPGSVLRQGADESVVNEIVDFRYPRPIDFRQDLRNRSEFTKKSIISNAPSYNPADRKTLEARTKLGDPGNNYDGLKDITSYSSGALGPAVPAQIKSSTFNTNLFQTLGKDGISPIRGASNVGSADYITIQPPFLTAPIDLDNDLVTFKIQAVNNDSPSRDKRINLYFRAYLDQISDNYTSEWDSIRYLGRGENFYNYRGFSRKISLGWTVAAQSKAELMFMYTKLNYLASLCAPDYSPSGYMRGNIVTLTVGGYVYEQYGIINGLSFEMNDENSTWEIAIDDVGDPDKTVKQLPHSIKVRGFDFTPIHNFTPEKVILNPGINGTRVYGDQRYISLADKNGNWWDDLVYSENTKDTGRYTDSGTAGSPTIDISAPRP